MQTLTRAGVKPESGMFQGTASGEDGDRSRRLARRLSDDSDEVMKGESHGIECDIVGVRAKEEW